ncbi:MAG TPA: hypothetical protein VF483_07060 [Gemmatimonadaceae bacterium]
MSVELGELWDRELDRFSPEQWKAALNQHRKERKGNDPDLNTVLGRLKGDAKGTKSDLTRELTVAEWQLREDLRNDPVALNKICNRLREDDERFAYWPDSWFVVEQYDVHRYVWTVINMERGVRMNWRQTFNVRNGIPA